MKNLEAMRRWGNFKKAQTISWAFTYVAIGLAIIYENVEIIRRLDLGYGLTDEAFSLSMAFERFALGSDSHVWPFSIPLAPLAASSSGSILIYRWFGYLITLLVAFLWSFTVWVKTSWPSKNLRNAVAGLVFLVAMLIPSTFSYLLATPTYQWTIQIALVLAATSLLQLREPRSHKDGAGRWFWLASLSLAVVTAALSRPTGGALLLFVSLIAFYFMRLRVHATLFTLGTAAILLGAVWILNPSLLMDYRLNIEWSTTLNPGGYSFLSEVWDVCKTLTIMGLLYALGLGLSWLRQKFNWGQLVPQALFALLAALVAYGLAKLSLDFFATLFLVGIGYLAHSCGRLPKLGGVVISTLPVIIQFGSAMDTIVTIPDNIFIGVFLLVFAEPVQTRKESGSPSWQVPIALGLCAAVICGYLLWQSPNNFEKTSGLSAGTFNRQLDLKFSPAKSHAIDVWKANSVGFIKSGDFIADLSFWHPGLIMYLNAWPLEQSPGDITYSGTINEQTREFFRSAASAHKAKTHAFIIEIAKGSSGTMGVCNPLSDYLTNSKMRAGVPEPLNSSKVKVVSRYISQPEDKTLFPKDAVLLVNCNVAK